MSLYWVKCIWFINTNSRCGVTLWRNIPAWMLADARILLVLPRPDALMIWAVKVVPTASTTRDHSASPSLIPYGYASSALHPPL
jgi:hypothetical protein